MKNPALTISTSAAFAFASAELFIPLAQLPFVNFQPKGPELGECALPMAHTASNFMTIAVNVLGIEGMERELYSKDELARHGSETQAALLREQQRYNVSAYVRSTEEMPEITSFCYPTMISTIFALTATDIRSANDGRMVNYQDYYDAISVNYPDLTEQQLSARVDDMYLPLNLSSLQPSN